MPPQYLPVGIATQDPKYRAKFKGKPENLINYLNAVATECREILAQLGCRTMDEVIGRTDFFNLKVDQSNPKTSAVDLSPLIFKQVKEGCTHGVPTSVKVKKRNALPAFDDAFADEILKLHQYDAPLIIERTVTNTDRNIGTRISGLIASRYGKEGLPSGSVQLKLKVHPARASAP